MEWNEILEKLSDEERRNMEDAGERINNEYYDRKSPNYRDNQWFSWAVKAIKINYEEKLTTLAGK